MQPVSALLRVLAALIGTLVAAGLAVLAALLLLLAALFFVAVRLRFLFIRLVGGVSHFPSPFAAQNIIMRHSDNPPGGADVPPFVAFSPGRGG